MKSIKHFVGLRFPSCVSSHSLQIIFKFIFSQCPQLEADMPISRKKKLRFGSKVICPRTCTWSVLLGSYLGPWGHHSHRVHFVDVVTQPQGGPTSLRTQSKWGIWHFLGLDKAGERSKALGSRKVGLRLLAARQERLTLASRVRPSFTTG